MGFSPEGVKKLKEDNNSSQINDIFYNAHFKHHQILVKAQQKNFGDESKINLYAFRVNEHFFAYENAELIKRL